MQTAERCKIGLVDGDGDGGQHGRGRLNQLCRRGHSAAAAAAVLDGDEGDVVGADEEVHFGLNYGMVVGVGVGSVFLNGSDGDAAGEREGGGGGGRGVVVARPLLAPARRQRRSSMLGGGRLVLGWGKEICSIS